MPDGQPESREPASHKLKQGFLLPPGAVMLWTVFAILIILWLLGWGFHIAGSLIHILLVLAIIVAVMNLVGGRRPV